MSSRLIISPTFDPHLAPSPTLCPHQKTMWMSSNQAFRACPLGEPRPGDFQSGPSTSQWSSHAACLHPCRLPLLRVLTVSSFASEQISHVMLDAPASGNVDEMLCQGSEGLYVLRLPTRDTPYELPVSPTTVTHFRKPSAAATRLIRSITVITTTEYRAHTHQNDQPKLKLKQS